MCGAPYRVEAVAIILGGIGRQGREELVAEQRGGIDVDMEIFRQAVVHPPEVGRSSADCRHFMVVLSRGRVAQIAVGFHHVLAHPFAEAEDGGPEAQQEIALGHVEVALDVDVRFVCRHGLGIGRGTEYHA